MKFFKLEDSEKSEEEKQWETRVKNKALCSKVLIELTEEYPEKFGDEINFVPVIEGDTITFTGNFDILREEIYYKEIEYKDKKETYKVILVPAHLYNSGS